MNPLTILEGIASPKDLQGLTYDQLTELAGEIRQTLIDTVAHRGGHLASNLGVVELTMALHRVFQLDEDRLVFDVGHQCYAHKLLTGRQEGFRMLRAQGGVSGFPKRDESPYDAFGTGHASTAISAAMGFVHARDVLGQKHHVIALVGDGALTGGMCYEALNDAGNQVSRLIVILNDNEMSISKNVGALSKHLTTLRASQRWRGTKTAVKRGLLAIPRIGEAMARGFEAFKNKIKHLFVSGEFFESLGYRYLGPIDGHDLPTLERVLREAKEFDDTPILVHVVTQKGRGYEKAERKPWQFHGVAPFLTEDGVVRKKSTVPSYGTMAAQELAEMGAEDPRIMAITAAMGDGTGLCAFEKKLPGRLYDVGIAEEHAVTMAAGMAAGGLLPYFAVYSTFLQRGYDQALHDACLQNLPIRLLVDRAGLVGEDGPTHHGVYDVAFLRHIPNMRLFMPRDEAELRMMLRQTKEMDGPVAIRYPRDSGENAALPPCESFTPGKWEILGDGSGEVALLTYGRLTKGCVRAAEYLQLKGIRAFVVNCSSLKPMDEAMLRQLSARGVRLVTAEEHSLQGGFGEAVAAFCAAKRLPAPMLMLGIPDDFMPHGSLSYLYRLCGLKAQNIALSTLAAWEREMGE